MYASTVASGRKNWSQTCRIVYQGHRHAWIHATYSHPLIFLGQVKIWNDQTRNYLSQLISNCPRWQDSPTPPPSCPVLLFLLKGEFNEVLYMDHFSLDSATVIHFMNVATLYAGDAEVDSTSMEARVFSIKFIQITQFCPLTNSQAYRTLQNDAFKTIIDQYKWKLVIFHRSVNLRAPFPVKVR